MATSERTTAAPPGSGGGPGGGLPEGHRDGGGSRPVGLGPGGWARWCWRQLTSMRTALLLLLLLAVAAVPGSLLPQRGIDQVRVSRYLLDHREVGPWMDRVGLFDVYASPWFSAVYLLLFISLVGCVLPRSLVHARALRQAPPRTPARLERLPQHRAEEVDAPAEAVVAAARTVLRRRRYRTADHPGSVAGQRGELRETGNLVFHLALVGVLVSVAVSNLYGYRISTIVGVGKPFVNSLAAYDQFDPGTLVDVDDLPPFRFVLKTLHVRFDGSSAGNQFGAPRDFRAGVDVVPAPGAAATRETIAVNSPLRIGGASVYLAGNGYAPVITVRDSTGQVAFTGQVPFLVQDSEYTSTGVVKVTDVARGQEQLGLQAQFFPTAKVDPVRGVLSTFPDLRNPELIFTAYAGDLGLDGGQPQNAYELDTSRMSQLQGDEGGPFRAALKVGQTVQLPGGRGSVTLDAVARYAGFTVEHDPARVPALVFALLAIAGLTTSLFVPRRRLWVRAVATGGDRTLLEVGVLARSEDPGLSAEADAVLAAVRAELGTALPTAAEQAPDQAAEPTDQQTEQQAEHRTTPRAGSSA